MPARSKVNYRETHFPHPTLTPIVGSPTYPSIVLLQQETNANLASVPTTLSDGLNGHVGLGLSETAYARGCSVPYARLGKPDKYVPPTKDDVILHQRAEKQHKELDDEFIAVNLLERTCLNMIKAALEPKILLPKTNRFNGTIKGTIPDIFKYLYKAYGNITNFSLEATRQSILAYPYNHEDPLDAPFSAIDDYADMSEAHGTPLSEETLKGLAEMILMKATVFADNIQKWKAGTATSWKDFQEYFIQAQEDYKEARPVQTAAALGYSSPAQANVTQAATDALREAEAYIRELEAAHQTVPKPPAPPVAAAVTLTAKSPQDELLSKLLAQMEELKTQVEAKNPRRTRIRIRKNVFTVGLTGLVLIMAKIANIQRRATKRKPPFPTCWVEVRRNATGLRINEGVGQHNLKL
jgi:hypothetical protein